MTDLELMQLLDKQGYEATLENLQILKEGLESGAYEIKNVATIEKKPSELTSDIDNEDVYDDKEHEQEEDVGKVVVESFSDYELYQLLEMEGYETTNENLKILKEGLYNGEIEILDESAVVGLLAGLGIGAACATLRLIPFFDLLSKAKTLRKNTELPSNKNLNSSLTVGSALIYIKKNGTKEEFNNAKEYAKIIDKHVSLDRGFTYTSLSARSLNKEEIEAGKKLVKLYIKIKDQEKK